MAKTLVAGPWVGEFGYELFRWQGYIRKQAEDYDQVIVSSRPGHEILYADFSDRYIPHAADLNPCEGLFNGTAKDIIALTEKTFAGIPYTTAIHPKRIKEEPQTFVPYGKDRALDGTILIHARAIKVAHDSLMPLGHKYQKESRNWSCDKWTKLVETLCMYWNVSSIGDPTASWHIPNTEDWRGISLADLADRMACAEFIVGPSSGPIHFATLCKCPQVVWGSPHLEDRYKTDWNPFQTPVEFLAVGEDWNPEIDQVMHSIHCLE